MSQLIAVYGTLKRGQHNYADYLSAAVYVGQDRLVIIALYDLGEYPGARLEASEGIDVEIYAVSDAQLRRLDELEEVDDNQPSCGLYTRELVDTRFGRSWIYLYNGPIAGLPVIRRGGWPAETGTSLASVDLTTI
jgi:gamma-glutamylcyclotransferase (GGCT)/AIG2-like uncharacterized protein YtfP